MFSSEHLFPNIICLVDWISRGRMIYGCHGCLWMCLWSAGSIDAYMCLWSAIHSHGACVCVYGVPCVDTVLVCVYGVPCVDTVLVGLSMECLA